MRLIFRCLIPMKRNRFRKSLTEMIKMLLMWKNKYMFTLILYRSGSILFGRKNDTTPSRVQKWGKKTAQNVFLLKLKCATVYSRCTAHAFRVKTIGVYKNHRTTFGREWVYVCKQNMLHCFVLSPVTMWVWQIFDYTVFFSPAYLGNNIIAFVHKCNLNHIHVPLFLLNTIIFTSHNQLYIIFDYVIESNKLAPYSVLISVN